ncbi:hypothetical protein HUG10_01605 [Halorarum halophilum]|uniref:Uncharacterized protein n=1 Tax=Halorarum halophilum TaxID=2743090 RepID=A0A7D5K5Z7_9EURY|nr:hypothetical protein [Halobaculum halophilum]QLG26314.1 hypothetical protein HUG10_01605 [Halobaculum halophilum]
MTFQAVVLTTTLPLAADVVAGDYRGLLFVATFLGLGGFILANHGAAAYALLLWEGGAGVLTWVYVEPALGAFFFLAVAFQFPLAAHLWGDPLRLRRRVGWLASVSAARMRRRLNAEKPE